jgi:hypothetical protein
VKIGSGSRALQSDLRNSTRLQCLSSRTVLQWYPYLNPAETSSGIECFKMSLEGRAIGSDAVVIRKPFV